MQAVRAGQVFAGPKLRQCECRITVINFGLAMILVGFLLLPDLPSACRCSAAFPDLTDSPTAAGAAAAGGDAPPVAGHGHPPSCGLTTGGCPKGTNCAFLFSYVVGPAESQPCAMFVSRWHFLLCTLLSCQPARSQSALSPCVTAAATALVSAVSR
jgi:hypothetical protein